MTHAHDNPFAEPFPQELVRTTTSRLPVKDYLAFKATCTYLHTLPFYATTLGPVIPRAQHSRASRYFYSAMTIGSISLYAGTFISPQLNTIITGVSFTVVGSFLTVGILASVSSRFCNLLDTAHDRLTNYEQRRQKAAKAQKIISLQQSLARCLLKHTCIIDGFHMQHCGNNADLYPLFRVARESNVSTITIDIDTHYDPQSLKLHQLLKKNNALKTVFITTRCQQLPEVPPISANSFAAGMCSNTYLSTLKLCGVNLSPHLLDTLFTRSPLKELVLNGCYVDKPYSFEALAKNTTLKNLALLYFTNHDTGINDTIVPIMLAFMQHNTNLKSLIIRSFFLSDAAKNQLNASPYKPTTFIVS